MSLCSFFDIDSLMCGMFVCGVPFFSALRQGSLEKEQYQGCLFMFNRRSKHDVRHFFKFAYYAEWFEVFTRNIIFSVYDSLIARGANSV